MQNNGSTTDNLRPFSPKDALRNRWVFSIKVPGPSAAKSFTHRPVHLLSGSTYTKSTGVRGNDFVNGRWLVKATGAPGDADPEEGSLTRLHRWRMFYETADLGSS